MTGERESHAPSGAVDEAPPGFDRLKQMC